MSGQTHKILKSVDDATEKLSPERALAFLEDLQTKIGFRVSNATEALYSRKRGAK